MKITPILLALVMTASLLLTSQFGFVAAGIIIVIMLAVNKAVMLSRLVK